MHKNIIVVAMVAAFAATNASAGNNYPIILAHGMFGTDSYQIGGLEVLDYWFGIESAMEDEGADVYVASVSPVHSSYVRGPALLAQIEGVLVSTGASKVHIIGHSQGGLDARWVAGMRPDLVRSVTTVSTPNQSNALAAFIDGNIDGQGLILPGLTNFFGPLLTEFGRLITGSTDPLDWKAVAGFLGDLTQFNLDFPNGLPAGCNAGPSEVDGINYYSWTGNIVGFLGVRTSTNVLDPTDPLLNASSLFFGLFEDNDGLVPVCDAQFGDVIGDNYLMNHVDTINHIAGFASPFETNPVTLYLDHVDRLLGLPILGAIVQAGPSVPGGQANLNPDVGQTFTTGVLGIENTLGAIAIEGPLTSIGSDPMGPFTLEVWTDLDGDHSTWDPGVLVATSDSQSMDVGNAATTFTFNHGVLLDNTVYAFTYTDGLGTRVAARMGLDNVNDLADGTLFGSGGQVFSDAYDTSMTITAIAAPGAIVQTGPSVPGGQANLSPDAGQTFTTGVLGVKNVLGTITVEGPATSIASDPMGPFTLEVWTDLDGDHSTWDPGVLVATSDSQSMDVANAATTFTFNHGVLLDNTVYAFTYTDGLGTRVAARMGLDNVNDLADGTLFGGGGQVFGDAYDTSMTITSFRPKSCGLGAEVAPILVLLAVVRGRRRRIV